MLKVLAAIQFRSILRVLRWVKTIATWKTVIESMQSLGMDNFRVAFTRFLAFYSDNPSGLRHGETLAKWPSKASFAPHPEDGGTFTVRHDLVGFVEPRESGIRNPEFVTLSYVTCWRLLYSFILFQLGEAQFALQ